MSNFRRSEGSGTSVVSITGSFVALCTIGSLRITDSFPSPLTSSSYRNLVALDGSLISAAERTLGGLGILPNVASKFQLFFTPPEVTAQRTTTPVASIASTHTTIASYSSTQDRSREFVVSKLCASAGIALSSVCADRPSAVTRYHGNRLSACGSCVRSLK